MSNADLLQLVVWLAVLVAATPVLGKWMAATLEGRSRWLAPVEARLLRLCGADCGEMTWREYATALVVFHAAGFALLLGILLCQGFLPLNPQHLPAMPLAVAVNTAVSFVTNTNWQAYSGEAVLSNFSQMTGLTVQNFLSAATGIAVLVALCRGIMRQSAATLGNFWVDLIRATVGVLLPASVVMALLLAGQGVVQSLAPPVEAHTLDGASQLIPLGPAASQIAIKQLGTNGGGFFGVNSAHPFENPTAFSNFLQCLAILLLPSALCLTFGRLTGRVREGWCLWAAMALLLLGGLGASLWSEAHNALAMEGKEVRFGVSQSVLWSTTTTAASNGSVNAMHSSFTPVATGVMMFQMMLGEVVFGGVGAGLYGMLLFVLLTVFMAGLMVGRSPEYRGKKLESGEIRCAIIGILAPSAVMLTGAALSLVTEPGRAALLHSGPHGLSEVLYAWTSAAANNGSAFAGLNAAAPWYAWGLSAAMVVGRFAVILPVLAIAGRLAAKKSAPPSAGTFPTDGATFVMLLVSVIIVVGGLTFLPVLSLGPLLEHFSTLR